MRVKYVIAVFEIELHFRPSCNVQGFFRAVGNVQCAVCNVQCAMCNVQCTSCNVQCALYFVQWAMCSVHCTSCSVHCTSCSVQGFLVQCAVSVVHCASCSVLGQRVVYFYIVLVESLQIGSKCLVYRILL